MSTLVPRLEGFHELNVSRVPKGQGLQGFKDRGFPLADRGFQEVWRFQNPRVSGINRSKDLLRGHGLEGFDIFKIQRFQGLRDAEFSGVQGRRVKGLKGS